MWFKVIKGRYNWCTKMINSPAVIYNLMKINFQNDTAMTEELGFAGNHNYFCNVIVYH
jgi:hypothetical protein